MKGKNVKIKESVKAEIKREFEKIRENKLLILGVSIGIIMSLIAGVIVDLIKTSTFYPKTYLFILIIILFILIFVLLIPYLNWKIFRYNLNKRMKETKKFIDMVEAHRRKYPVKKVG